MDKPNTIVVNTIRWRDVPASRVDVHVTVRGSSLLLGRAALDKAHEVRSLVAGLESIGVERSAVELLRVNARVASEMIGKSSDAAYELLVKLPRLDLLPEAVGLVVAQKNASVSRLAWVYDELDRIHDELLVLALQEAQARMDLLCRVTRHRNLGIHSLWDKATSVERGAYEFRGVPMNAVATAAGVPGPQMDPRDFGLDIAHSCRFSVEVRLECLVAPIEPGEDA